MIPNYRPFKDINEVINAIKEYGNRLRHKDSGFICKVTKHKGNILIIGDCSIYELNDAFNDFTFADGTPFGVKKN